MSIIPQATATQQKAAGPTGPARGFIVDRQPRTWTRKILPGGQHDETCPTWCTDHHRNDRVSHFEDLSHGAHFTGTEVTVFNTQGEGRIDMPVFAGRINVDPYSEDPERRVPHVNLEPWQDEVMEGLTPDQLADVIGKLRGLCEHLEGVETRLRAALTEHAMASIKAAEARR